MASHYEHAPRIRDLRRLTRSTRSNGEEAIEKYYDWREARALSVAKGAGGAALSLLTAWLIPFLKDEFRFAPPFLVLAPPLLLVAGFAIWGLLSLMRMDRIHRSFITTVCWLQALRA
jgi:hypothetical protein